MHRRKELIDNTGKSIATSLFHCGNHRVNLIENVTADVLGHDVSVFMICGSTFFSMGGNYLRLVQALGVGVDRWMAKPVFGLPPEDAKPTTDELMDYCVRNYKGFTDVKDDAWSSDEDEQTNETDEANMDDAVRKGRRDFRRRHYLYRKSWESFVAIFNGIIWATACTVGPHYALDLVDFANLKHRAVVAIARVLFRSMPKRPCKGKWTKLGPCADWWMLALGTMNLLTRLWNIAYKEFLITVVKLACASEPELTQDFNWHELRSKRCKYIESGLTEATVTSLVILCIVLEPLRFLTKWFLKRGSSFRRTRRQKAGKTPPLCDLVWLTASPATRVLQYFSLLMSGRAKRLRLLWARGGHSSFEQWAAHNPATLAVLRRAIMVASSLVHFRFIKSCICTPWVWASLADCRRTDLDDVRAQLWHMADELLDEWFAVVVILSW